MVDFRRVDVDAVLQSPADRVEKAESLAETAWSSVGELVPDLPQWEAQASHLATKASSQAVDSDALAVRLAISPEAVLASLSGSSAWASASDVRPAERQEVDSASSLVS